MNDQISRQKLIEAVEKEYHRFIDNDRDVAHNRAIYDVLEIIKAQPPADQCVPLSEVYRVIAGHSDYHGDNILAALTCIAAGKEVKPVRPLPADVPDTNVGEWIPFTSADGEEAGIKMLTCRLPEDGEEILVTDGRYVWEDTFMNDGGECWLDSSNKVFVDEVTAWQPKPEPYKGVE